MIYGERLNNQQLNTNLNSSYRDVGGKVVSGECSSSSPEQQPPLALLSLKDVKHLINELDTSKATSQEDFPTWLAKDGKEDICVPIQDINNTMLTTGQYPDHWKRAQMTPMPKVPTPKLYKDFRPISLLFHMGKLCEQVIVNKLKDSIQTIISSTQYAYRPKLGTTDAILQLIDDITTDLDCPENKYTQMACLDFSKAFDKLQPNIVIDKMKNYGINIYISNMLSSFLERRKQCVIKSKWHLFWLH